MTDNIIKNPKRDLNKTPEKYVPEHTRLGAQVVKIPASVGDKDQLWTGDKEVLEVYNDAEPIPEDEIKMPEDELKAKEDIGLSSVTIGDYILIHDGSVVVVGDVEEIKDAISFLSIKREIPIEEFLVFKRCDIKVGIFVE